MLKNTSIDYLRYCNLRREISDTIEITDPNKISDFIDDKTIEIVSEFNFSFYNKIPTIEYNIRSKFNITCQVSLENYEFEIDSGRKVAIVEDDRILNEPELEPFICIDKTIDLKDIIAEEITLALPMVPKKPLVKMDRVVHNLQTKENIISKNSKNNPFDILKELKKS